MKTWKCKVGEAHAVPRGADGPMRKAVARAYKELTGEEPEFIFSGWGGELTEQERAVVEDRNIRDRYEAAEYGWQDGVDKAIERVPEQVFDAEQMQAYALAAYQSALDQVKSRIEAMRQKEEVE